MTMSWLAEQKATITASSAVWPGSMRGSTAPRPSSAATSAAWVASSQPRRRPNTRDRTGSGSRSISGAHRNFRL